MTGRRMPDLLAHPPPLSMNLLDGDRLVGWISDEAIAFQGFDDETEAVHAAWVAHKALVRRFARTHGTRVVESDPVRLALQRGDAGEPDMIIANDRRIASLVRPGPDSRTGDSFGFELAVPTPTSPLRVRATAYRIYRTLRKSGVRWPLWEPNAIPRVERLHEVTNAESAEASRSRPALTSYQELVMTTPLAPTRMALPPPTASGNSHGSLPPVRTDANGRDASTGAMRWATIGVLSVSLLVVSLVADEGVGALLAAVGLAGLAILRFAALTGGWVERRSIGRTRPTERDHSARLTASPAPEVF